MLRHGQRAFAVLGLLIVAGTPLALVSTATASPVGTLTITPSTGTWQTGMVLNMSGPCPGGVHLFAKVYGAGFPISGWNVVANSAQNVYPTNSNGGRTVALSNTMKAFAEAQSPPATLSGEYRFELICRDKLGMGGPTGEGFGEFVGSVVFNTSTAYVQGGSVVIVPKPTVTLAASPRTCAKSGWKAQRPSGGTRRRSAMSCRAKVRGASCKRFSRCANGL